MKVLIWILCYLGAIVCNVLLGFVTGFRAGYLVVYLVVSFVAARLCRIWDRRKQPKTETPPARIQIAQCGQCGYKGQYTGNCPRCGYAGKRYFYMDTGKADMAMMQPEGDAAKAHFCTKCGAQLLEGANFCNKCGAKRE